MLTQAAVHCAYTSSSQLCVHQQQSLILQNSDNVPDTVTATLWAAERNAYSVASINSDRARDTVMGTLQGCYCPRLLQTLTVLQLLLSQMLSLHKHQ